MCTVHLLSSSVVMNKAFIISAALIKFIAFSVYINSLASNPPPFPAPPKQLKSDPGGGLLCSARSR